MRRRKADGCKRDLSFGGYALKLLSESLLKLGGRANGYRRECPRGGRRAEHLPHGFVDLRNVSLRQYRSGRLSKRWTRSGHAQMP